MTEARRIVADVHALGHQTPLEEAVTELRRGGGCDLLRLSGMRTVGSLSKLTGACAAAAAAGASPGAAGGRGDHRASVTSGVTVLHFLREKAKKRKAFRSSG